MKLLPAILLLLACSATAKDYRYTSVHRHDKAIVMVYLPEYIADDNIQMLCKGTQAEMNYRGIDCYPAIPQPKPKELASPTVVNTKNGFLSFPVRVGLPESMF